VDQHKIDAFWNARAAIADRRLATNFRDDGRLAFDTALVQKFLPPDARILDLGAGTCTLSQQFLSQSGEIVAVDKFAAFLDNAPAHPKLRKICADVASFSMNEQFDMILLFGVVNFLSPAEESQLYRSCAAMLADGGHFIVKNQCGVDDEVIVDSYSEELKAHYHARYPAVEEQQACLAEHFEVELLDIYPADLNRWESTHFYAFICNERAALEDETLTVSNSSRRSFRQ
jgi:cyclopropane fatty-acyl-phospholipid synthase-like methyltransferase